jgi:hypothetical protein
VNLGIEVHLYLDEEQFAPEEIARLTLGVSDFIRENGYGNVAAEDVADTRLTSVVIVRPIEANDWTARAEDAMAVNFPTDDQRFVLQAESGGIDVGE